MADENCWIYKGDRRDEMYLYVAGDGDFSNVPETLLTAMGKLEFVMSIRLHEERKLARADIRQVMSELDSKGYYLQMPPPPGEGFDEAG